MEEARLRVIAQRHATPPRAALVAVATVAAGRAKGAKEIPPHTSVHAVAHSSHSQKCSRGAEIAAPGPMEAQPIAPASSAGRFQPESPSHHEVWETVCGTDDWRTGLISTRTTFCCRTDNCGTLGFRLLCNSPASLSSDATKRFSDQSGTLGTGFQMCFSPSLRQRPERPHFSLPPYCSLPSVVSSISARARCILSIL